MKASPKRFYEGKPVNATEFLAGSGWFVQLARTATSPLVLVLYRGNDTDNEARFHFFCGDCLFWPTDEITRHVRFAHSPGGSELVACVSAFEERS